ncbi:hypothetical protein KC340_g17868, partial [Hortaea werneckii]
MFKSTLAIGLVAFASLNVATPIPAANAVAEANANAGFPPNFPCYKAGTCKRDTADDYITLAAPANEESAIDFALAKKTVTIPSLAKRDEGEDSNEDPAIDFALAKKTVTIPSLAKRDEGEDSDKVITHEKMVPWAKRDEVEDSDKVVTHEKAVPWAKRDEVVTHEKAVPWAKRDEVVTHEKAVP